jgi:asparagine synthase (glutamine-hydrolysing)
MIDGIFGFALCYDDEFMAARDLIGVKQLYYGRDAEGRWFFASEMKVIEESCGNVELAPFPPGHYFTPKTG